MTDSEVDSDMNTALAIVIMLALLVAVLVYVPRFFVKRAMRKVVAIFRKVGATSPKQATTLESLGLVQAGFVDRMFKPRDYRPQAARLLIQVGIILPTDDGTYYLSEQALEDSPVKKWAGIEDRPA